MKKRLAIIITHPIQYYSPLFQILGNDERLDFKVFYTWSQTKEEVFDQKFGKTVKWDIPLLEGYEYEFVDNTSKNPNSFAVSGIINPELNSKVEAWNPSSILIFGWNHKSHLDAMKYFKGKVPVYFRGDSTWIDEIPLWKKLARKLWLRRVYKKIDYALHVGKHNKAYFRSFGIKESQLLYAPHVIDNQRFYETSNQDYAKKARQLRSDLGYTDNDLVFLFVGKFEHKKHPKLLLEAAKLLKEYQFLFVGNGDLESELKRGASDCENVNFIDFQNQSMMPVVYRVGQVYVLPSQGPGETWGLAVNEAMACGIPAITSTKVGCTPDLIKAGTTGYSFDSNDLSDLVENLKLAAAHHKELGINALQLIKQYDMQALASAIIGHIK